MKNQTPYPKPIEIIRFIAKAFDIKNSKKALDDNAFNVYVDTQTIKAETDSLIEKIRYPLLGEHLQQYLFEEIKRYLIDTVGKNEVVDISNTMFIKRLTEKTFTPFLLYFLNKFTQPIKPDIGLCLRNKNSLPIVFNWIEKKYVDFERQYDKNWQDQIQSWKNSKHLPSNQSISLLKDEYKGDEKTIDWNELQSLLLLARALDFYKKEHDKLRLIQQETPHNQYFTLIDLLQKIDSQLQIKKNKKNVNSKNILSDITNARRLLLNTGLQDRLVFMVDFFEARWCIFSGDLEKALPFYKKAFEGCLYRAGGMQEKIITETLVVASSQKEISQILLKQLKISLVNFNYQLPSNRESYAGKSPKYSDVMQDWEVDFYHKQFISTFKVDNLFINVEYQANPTKLDPIPYLIDDDKPDYRYPNRKIKQKHLDGGKKIIPQIVLYTQQKKIDVVEKLLKKNADVNAVSSSNETAIGMALENMDVFQPQPPSAKLFNLIGKYIHKKQTLNIRTNKKKLLPIISAVNSGKPIVVKKILEMGANPNALGSVDEQTALNFCLKYIHLLKSSSLKEELESQLLSNKPPSPKTTDTIARYTGKLHMPNNTADILNVLMELQIKNIRQFLTLDNLYEIADLLLESGANPNQENFYPINGHTSLMLAAEYNEYGLFEKMLKREGDIGKTFVDTRNSKQYNCLDIANFYRSKEVIAIIKKN